MGIAGQLASVTCLGLRSLPNRVGASLVVVVGVAMAVAVFVSVFAMAEGFQAAMAATGHSDRAIVLGGSADTESASSLSRESVAIITDAGGIRHTADGKPLVSPESIAFVPLTDARSGLDSSVTLRGVGPLGVTQLRPEIRVVEGRMFRPGAREVIVGRAVQKRMKGVSVGGSIAVPEGDWPIVGVFESGRDARESELLTDSETLMATYRRTVFNTVTVALEDAGSSERLEQELQRNPKLSVSVVREDVYVARSSALVRKLLRVIALGIGAIMAFGAAFGALNTMYSSTSTRAAEIATLRAIGFHPAAVVTSVLVESLVLALAGAVIGTLLAWILFNGTAVSTLSGNNPSQVTFVLKLSPHIALLGIGAACLIGLVGGAAPAVRAGIQSIATAVRKA